MKKKYILLFLITSISLVAIIYMITANNNQLNSLLKELNKSRRVNQSPNIDVSKYMYNYSSNSSDLTKQELDNLASNNLEAALKSFNEGKHITQAEAIEDINYVFKTIKNSYAGYLYFGGDEAFDKAKSNIIEQISKIPTNITSSQLELMLVNNLNFINDGHFSVNTNVLVKKLNYYSNSICFYKDLNGFYKIENRKKFYLSSISEKKEFKDYLKPSLDSEGKLCYNIGFLLEKSINTINVTYTSEEITYKETLQLKNSFIQNNPDNIGFNKYSIDNIPIISIRRMFDSDKDDTTIDSFEKSAFDVKSQPIFILDLRGNGGGQDIAPIKWFSNLTGFKPSTNEQTIKLYSKVNKYLTREKLSQIDTNSIPTELKDELNSEILNSQGEATSWYVKEEKATYHKSNKTIIVLIDNEVASSAESFVSYLRTLENVIFIGTNTSGRYIGSSFTNCILKNSGIAVSFGNSLTFLPKSEYEEGRGFEPDLWVNTNDILDKTIKFIKVNYR